MMEMMAKGSMTKQIPTAEVESFLARAEQLEEVAAKLYDSLARRFDGDPDASRLFRRLEQEENAHRERVRFLVKQWRDNPTALGQLTADRRALDLIYKDAETLLSLFAADPFWMTVDEVKQFMVELEHKFARAHVETILAGGQTELRRFFELMAQDDEAHASLLETVGQRR